MRSLDPERQRRVRGQPLLKVATSGPKTPRFDVWVLGLAGKLLLRFTP